MTDSPYKGIDFFVEADEELFFGRDEERKRIIGNLTASRLTLLYAESGVGKSSLLRAGVAARLRHSPRPYLPIVYSAWTGDPTAGLLGALGGADGSLEEALERKVTDGALPLVILDQFEDHLYDRSDEATRFDDALARCIARPDLRANFLIAVREDAYSRIGDRFKARLPNVYGNFLHLDFLDERAARDAATLPLEVLNARLENGRPRYELGPGLLDAVLGDVHRVDDDRNPVLAADGTPRVETAYLQLVLERLWDEERANGSPVLRLETLERLGGADTIVSAHVDDVLDALTPPEQDAAADALRFFVTAGGRKLALGTAEVSGFSGVPPETLEPVLEHLQDHRILRPVVSTDAEPRREVFHDILARPITAWRGRHVDARRFRGLERRNRILAAAVAVLAAVTAALILYAANPIGLRKLELATIDMRFRLRPERTPSDVVFVAVDDRTEATPRRLFARVIGAVDAAAPRVIAVDVSFDSPLEGQPARAGTPELVSAVKDASAPVALAAVDFSVSPGESGGTQLVPLVLAGDARLSDDCAADGVTYGYAGLPDDPDGRVRRIEGSVPGRGAGDPSMCTFAVVAAHLAGAGDAKPSLETARRRAWSNQTYNTAWIDYPGGPDTIREVSSADLLNGRTPPGALRDKVVVVGSAAEPTDTLRTPFSSAHPGPKVQAAAIDTVLHGEPLRDAPVFADLALLVTLLVTPVSLIWVRSWFWAAALAVATVIALLGIVIGAFAAGYVVSVVLPLIVLALITASGTIVTLVLTGRARAAAR
ncbi:CHASE2 domain-containing protein [Solirubrobacter ginsenosidimutans]|uniref:CHASE2 domain-containing protein n=1 Tax=Solirubrobacter ginsenosidimutans TaxID=490573 RepID=A0A9X3S095_9ACTN|nr:CHASE2 domain-containing protein [Solirubrobacter ginsenosidimutans]MDA0159797.1 CHASE2 domain-containing protein [Solirubrobacter ginsenosidimutans]